MDCRVVVAGGGVLGSQIAYQAAFKGCDVTMWLRSEGSIGRTLPKVARLRNLYQQDLEACRHIAEDPEMPYPRGLIDDPAHTAPEMIDALIEQADRAHADLGFTLDLAEAVADADIVIESVAEVPDQKTELFSAMAPHLPEKTIVVTNSSTLLPSMFAEATGRPEKFLSLHFANNIWRNNAAEVMGHDGTDPEAYEQVVEFASRIGMIPLRVLKEQPGYLLNSLLVPILSAAEALLVRGVSDAETIDKAWVLGTGAPRGPFQILDVVGLDTAYNIATNHPLAKDPNSVQAKIVEMLKAYIDQGKTGVHAGEGFYKYS